jgi:hypothetical protein
MVSVFLVRKLLYDEYYGAAIIRVVVLDSRR